MFLILQETSATAVQTYLSPKSLIHATYRCIKSGSQRLLSSNSLMIRFKSKNDFIFEISKVGHLIKKRLSRGKRNYVA